jgi:hypothetical protein
VFSPLPDLVIVEDTNQVKTVTVYVVDIDPILQRISDHAADHGNAGVNSVSGSRVIRPCEVLEW